MDPDPVGLTEIAERLGVRTRTAYTWRDRELLPDPDWFISDRPVWRWATIKRWAIDTGRLS